MFPNQKTLCAITLATLVLSPHNLTAQTDLGFALPESVGLSPAVLDTATARLQRHVDAGNIPGAVAAVARDGRIVYFQSVGLMNIDTGRPMADSALFRSYSMTRQITSVAILMLEPDGLLSVADPIQTYLPQFAEQTVFLDPENPDLEQTRPRVGDITIAHLLTHTGGLGARSEPIYVANNVRDRNLTLDEVVDNVARMPLFSDPGTQFRYGLSATVLGKVIEVVSGQPLEDFLHNRLFAPVGMVDTVFYADSTRLDRLTTVYRPRDGALYPFETETVPFSQRPRLIEGGVGLLSTVMDFMRFSQMLLNGGEINGVRILQPATVEKIFTNAVPDEALPLNDRGYWAGSGWTLGGFNVVLDPGAYSFPVSMGTIWWDGSTGTRYFIDREQSMVSVIMAPVSPAGGGGFREEFKELVDGAILQRR